MNNATFQELTTLFFSTRQIIREKLPGKRPDPNAWLRFETLRYIQESKNPTMQDVARHLHVKAPSATSLISYLLRDGFVVRAASSEDRRVVRISLSKKGERLLRGYRVRSTATMRKVFMKLGTREIQNLVRILRRVQDIHRDPR
jgi:DNA-binding MarR family transcriptional regulator